MSWQSALAKIIKQLRREEARLVSELESLRAKIASLGGASSTGRGKRTVRRTLSPAGRAAIARAARRRWAKYRAAKKG